MTARKKGGLRAALAEKKTRVEHFDIPIADSDTVDKLVGRLNDARQALTFANISDDKAAQNRAQAEVDKVQAEVDACFYRVHFKGLSSDADLDALMNAHPPTDEQRDKGLAYNPDTFDLALLVASITGDDEMTEDEWRAEVYSDKWTRADRRRLFDTVTAANTQSFSDSIPKG